MATHGRANIQEAPLILGQDRQELEMARRPTITLRSTALGLIIGIFICLSNVYFGLQTGHADTMAIPSALLGFAFFRVSKPFLKTPFGTQENSFVQTVAGAVGAMPLSAGLISVIAALEYLIKSSEGGPLSFDWLTLAMWSLGLCFFGMISAMLLRTQYMGRKELPFPSATASATIIKSLHDSRLRPPSFPYSNAFGDDGDEYENSGLDIKPYTSSRTVITTMVAFTGAGTLTIVAAFFPILHNIPFLGSYMARQWLLTFNLSSGMFGAGIVTGPTITLHMFAGAIVGWAVLSPMASYYGWAPGVVNDWEHGSRGWTLWISLATLLTDCLINLLWILANMGSALKIKTWVRSLRHSRISKDCWQGDRRRRCIYVNTDRDEGSSQEESHLLCRAEEDGSLEDPADVHKTMGQTAFGVSAEHLLMVGLAAATIVCVAAVKLTFESLIPTGSIILAVTTSLPLSIVSMRAMGQTDYSPVSGLGKLSQFLFALIISRSDPNKIVINLIVGAITEAGAMQAAVLIFGLKTGSLLDTDPMSLMVGHMIGSIFGAFLSSGLYKLYTKMYAVPGSFLQVPTAYIWLSAARLAYGSGLPPACLNFCMPFAVVTAVSAILKIRYRKSWWSKLLPNGVAFAIGIYNAPAFTLPRTLGGVAGWLLEVQFGINKTSMNMAAAGLILGESLFSLTGLFLPQH